MAEHPTTSLRYSVGKKKRIEKVRNQKKFRTRESNPALIGPFTREINESDICYRYTSTDAMASLPNWPYGYDYQNCAIILYQ